MTDMEELGPLGRQEFNAAAALYLKGNDSDADKLIAEFAAGHPEQVNAYLAWYTRAAAFGRADAFRQHAGGDDAAAKAMAAQSFSATAQMLSLRDTTDPD